MIAGMRRTGTTILFDAFVRDDRFTTLYEPLNLISDRPTIGGGSGSHDTDLFADVRRIQADFLRSRPELEATSLNHGGPTQPEVERVKSLPVHVREYLSYLLDQPRRPYVAKFVRMNHRLDHLRGLDPTSVLVWTVRDPRAVVASHLLGRGRRFANRYPDAEQYFNKRTSHDPWSVRRLAESIVGEPAVRELSDLERVLVVWGDTVRAMATGATAFGDDGLSLRHEDLSASGSRTLSLLFDRLEGTVDMNVADWYESTVRPAQPAHYENDPRWNEAFERVGISDLVDGHGY